MKYSGIERRHAISGAFVFMLLGVFAVFSTLLVLFGAQGYRATVERSEAHNDHRVISSYVRYALRSDDTADALSILSGENGDILAISINIDGNGYVKYIYTDEGMLKELFVDARREFDASEGETICPADMLSARFEGKLLRVEITDADGTVYGVDVALKCVS